MRVCISKWENNWHNGSQNARWCDILVLFFNIIAVVFPRASTRNCGYVFQRTALDIQIQFKSTFARRNTVLSRLLDKPLKLLDKIYSPMLYPFVGAIYLANNHLCSLLHVMSSFKRAKCAPSSKLTGYIFNGVIGLHMYTYIVLTYARTLISMCARACMWTCVYVFAY